MKTWKAHRDAISITGCFGVFIPFHSMMGTQQNKRDAAIQVKNHNHATSEELCARNEGKRYKYILMIDFITVVKNFKSTPM